MNTQRQWAPIERSELVSINGGGFAYDVGRVLRFLSIYGGNPLKLPEAMTDWYVNDLINKLENG